MCKNIYVNCSQPRADEKTRGYIESGIDELLKSEINEAIKWLVNRILHKSPRDLGIGILVGAAIMKARLSALVMQMGEGITEKDKIQIMKMVERRLPEIVEKVERELNR